MLFTSVTSFRTLQYHAQGFAGTTAETSDMRDRFSDKDGNDIVPHEDRPPREGKALILVVDRDPHVQALERFFLEEASFTVELAEDGRRGFELARALLPDILISEILVPGMDGLSICRAIKADPTTQHILVVIFSLLAAEDRAQDAGADLFLRKPIDDALFVKSVERLLATH
jgi:CheY-like chemotaxis protein